MRDSNNTYLYNTPETALEAVQEHGLMLEFVPEELRTYEICLAAVQAHPHRSGCLLRFVPEELRTYEICLAAVQKDGFSLQFVPEKLRTYEICLAAVQAHPHRSGCLLRFVPEELRTYEIYLAAVQKNAGVLQIVPEAVQMNNPAICLAAVQRNGMALQFVPEAVQMNNPAICLAAVQRRGMASLYVTEEFNTTANNALLTLANDSVSDFKSNLSLLSVIPTVSLELINTVKNVRWMREFRHLFLTKINSVSALQKFFNTGEQGITDKIFSFISPKAMSLLKYNNDICKATLSRAELEPCEPLLNPPLDAKQAYRSPINMVSDYLHGDLAQTDAKTDSATSENNYTIN
jgi:hypothetical protein